jgi:hypothetical protein
VRFHCCFTLYYTSVCAAGQHAIFNLSIKVGLRIDGVVSVIENSRFIRSSGSSVATVPRTASNHVSDLSGAQLDPLDIPPTKSFH